tara:strand:+ start:3607 stop:4467 length:861 start_codon:yes stop_codon:yes gene_type:complete
VPARPASRRAAAAGAALGLACALLAGPAAAQDQAAPTAEAPAATSTPLAPSPETLSPETPAPAPRAPADPSPSPSDQAAPPQAAPSQTAPGPAQGQTAQGQTGQGQTRPGAAQAPSGALGPRATLPRSPILIVNRQAVLENSAAARALQETERETLERVTAELERVKTELQVEEQELTRLKPTLPPDQFDARAREFDRKVKAERAAGQDRRALFQKFTQEARQALASALPRVLEALRRETGSLVLLDASAVAAADPALDVTNLAIERYDAEMGAVRFDPPDDLMPR